jgi:ABC-type branched-subunit amino acid transport system ATPase component
LANRGLRCEKLRKSFDGVLVLDIVGIDFPTKGSVGIIGPNGAGKTTLLNIITGFTRQDAGRCYIGGIEITGHPPYHMAKHGISRTFQDIRLIKRCTVLENIMLALPSQRGERLGDILLRKGLREDEAKNFTSGIRILHLVDLQDKVKQLAGELSYGQQKLLALACCLATGAQILLLDEPVSGIDINLKSTIIEIIRQECDEGKLVIFVEHDIDAVRTLADQVIVIAGGQVKGKGTPNELLNRPEIMEAYLG